jgi:hypothetical protein
MMVHPDAAVRVSRGDSIGSSVSYAAYGAHWKVRWIPSDKDAQFSACLTCRFFSLQEYARHRTNYSSGADLCVIWLSAQLRS